jgi:hypothetical protein
MYPKAIALGLMICSGLYIIKIMKLYKSGTSFSTEKNNFRATWEQAGIKLAAMWILLIAYVYFVRPIGYFETGFLFLALSMFFLGERDLKWLVSSLGISAVITFFSYLVFVKLLNTYLPSGILFKM